MAGKSKSGGKIKDLKPRKPAAESVKGGTVTPELLKGVGRPKGINRKIVGNELQPPTY